MNNLEPQEIYIKIFIATFSRKSEAYKKEFSKMGLKNNEIRKTYKENIDYILYQFNQINSKTKESMEEKKEKITKEIDQINFIRKNVFEKNRLKPNDELSTQIDIDLSDWKIESLKKFADKVNDNSMKSIIKKKLKTNGYYDQKQMLNDFLNISFCILQKKKDCIDDLVRLYTQDMQIIKSEYEKNKNLNIEEREMKIKQNVIAFSSVESSYKQEVEEYIGDNEKLNQFVEIFKKISKRKVNIGNHEKSFKSDSIFYEVLKKKDENNCIDYDSFKQEISVLLPVYIDVEENPILSIKFDCNSCAKTETLIQDFVLSLMEGKNYGEFEISYIDFYEKAADLGLLLNLSDLPSNKPCLKIITAKKETEKFLSDIENYTEKVVKKIIGFDSVRSYNSQSENKINHKVIIINHFGVNFDSIMYEKLSTTLSNLKRCGISLVLINQDDIVYSVPEGIASGIERQAIKLSICKNSEFHLDKKIIMLKSVDRQNIAERTEILKEKLSSVVINNHYSEIIENELEYFPVVDGLSIPFAKDENGEIKYLEIGSNISTHLLLSGITGSGKSNTLHTIIIGILNRYSPEDVDLWLVDYKKVEFRKYLDKRPQHLKVIGLERSQQFSYSLIDELTKEYEKRLEIFQEYNVENLKNLIEKGIKMPRVVVIDEFHHLTQAIQTDLNYATKLENLLSESRAVGFSFVFSDQAITVGLRGFSEKSQNQVATRLAMNNNEYEIKQTLALNNIQNELIKENMKILKQGDVLLKQASNESEFGITIGKFKVLRTTDQDIDSVINKINNKYNIHKNIIIAQGQDAQICDWEEVGKFELSLSLDNKTIPIFLGTPLTLEPCFYVPLRKEMDGNIAVISNSDELKASILIHMMKSFLRQDNSKVVICTMEEDDCYSNIRVIVEGMKNVEILMDYKSICDFIYEQSSTSSKENILTVWLGLEIMSKEFKSFGSRSDTEKSTNDYLKLKQSSLMEQIMNIDKQLSEGEPKEKEIKSDIDEEPVVYNALEDLNRYFTKGPKRGSFSIVVFDSVRIFNKVREIRLDEFSHKIATRMSMEDFFSFTSNSSMAREFDDTNAIYTSDGIHFNIFKPYKMQ